MFQIFIRTKKHICILIHWWDIEELVMAPVCKWQKTSYMSISWAVPDCYDNRLFKTFLAIPTTREGAGKRILVGQAPNTILAPGGALLHKSTNIGMAVAIPAIPPAPSLQYSLLFCQFWTLEKYYFFAHLKPLRRVVCKNWLYSFL